MKLAIFGLFAALAVCHGASFNSPARGPLIWQEEFDSLDYSRWKHLITAWRGGNNEFQYYDNLPENRYYYLRREKFIFSLFKLIYYSSLQSYTQNGVLYIKPTLTADRFGEDFLYNGVLDLNAEGCNINIDGGCYV